MTPGNRPASRTYWLVDLENTHSRWTLASGRFRPGDVVVLFWSPSVTKVPLEDVSCCGDVSYRFVKCTNGTPNAMDFQITAWLGRMSAMDPSARFVILSGDHGYVPLVPFLGRFDVDVHVTDPDRFAVAIAPAVPTQPATTDDAPGKPADEAPMPAPPQAPKTGGTDPVRQLYLSKLKDFGVDDDQDLSAMADILYISMQSPQNKRKLGVRNRMMAHYGTQDGNLRYNAMKDLIHDIANNGPWPKPGPCRQIDPDAMNRALSTAGITLKQGQVAKAIQAVNDALCAAKPKDTIYKAVGRIFDPKDHEKANKVLRSFLKPGMKRGA